MSLRCSFTKCKDFELAKGDQLAFYQDINNGGWNLGLAPVYTVNSLLPPDIKLINTGDEKFPFNVLCLRCDRKIGKVNAVCGFEEFSINFSATKVILLQEKYTSSASATSAKWSKVIGQFPQILKMTASIPEAAPLTGKNTVHFHGIANFKEMAKSGNYVADRSSIFPRRYQWRAYFFACLHNTLLCLPTGMGKTLIGHLLIKAYRTLNPNQAQIFIVPTVVLVEQQAATIERNTGLKVMRRSSEHNSRVPWTSKEVAVCTPAMLNHGFKMKQIDMSQIALLVFDEVHEANSPNSEYGLILPLIAKCHEPHRPRILALTASPSGVNTKSIRESILGLCDKLDALPFSPLVDDEKNTHQVKDVDCEYIDIGTTPFELCFEKFVFTTLENLAKLDSFFESNWNEVNSNVAANIRVHAVDKVLSHAESTARYQNNEKLFQLTRFMKKWSQSLDLLKIFGPKKLLEFIRSDLNYAYKSDSLKEIREEILAMIPSFLEKFSEMESKFNIESDSTRAAILMEKLKQHRTDTSRIIVFVERRMTAERICRRLQEDPDTSSLNPEFIVGMSSGGISKERQQDIMKKFRDGTCQVLIATSVLEQGIDVAACNVVICFDGVKSIKSIIQSRGRARKQAASFIVFVSTEGRSRVNELTSKELEMDYAIQQLMHEKDSKIEIEMDQEIDNFLDGNFEETVENINDDENEVDEIDEENEELEEFEDSFLIVFRFFNYSDQEALIEHISSFFTSPRDRLKSSKKFVVAKFNVKDNVEERSKLIRKISTVKDSKQALSLSTWIQSSIFHDEKHLEIKAPVAFLKFDSLHGFFFKDCVTVCIETKPIWSDSTKLHIQNNEITLARGHEFFTITAFDISGPILINETENSLEIFLCLGNPPKFFTSNERTPFNFIERSFNLRLKNNSNIAPQEVWRIRKALEFFSLEVHNVANLKQVQINNYNEGEIRSFQKSYLIKAWHSKHAAVLPPKLPKHIYDQLNAVSTKNLPLVLDNNFPERFQKLKFYDLKDSKPLPFGDILMPSNYFLVGRVKVTPSRLIFMPMVATPKNRIFRYFPDPDNFLIVSLTDEHEENPWQSQAVYDWFLSVLETGIKVGAKIYTFLGCSNSQLREGHCWFSCLDRSVVYKKIGTFPDTMNAGRKLTRLALAFAASVETVTLDHEKYLKRVAPDIKNSAGVCFSDGIGRGSRELFSKLTVFLKLKTQPSAFQIRVGGVKGVISVFDQQEDVMFRDSMKKFESNHDKLEVLEYSKPIKLFLNRHVILLLSNFGVPNEVFMNLQFIELEKCMNALTDIEKSIEFVRTSSKIIPWELVPADRLSSEPLFHEILLSNAIELFSKIVDRAHIFVDKGQVLMGVLDETNTLEYGEVYANIVDKDIEKVLEGEVVVFRNPAVLPSDIRRLTARSQNLSKNFKDLYKNCLVIPSRGKSCHAHECSGGDLDGDLYYIIWDELLMPPKLPKPGKEVIEVETIVTHTPTGNSERDMMEFFCDYSQNFQLGVIANAHLATSDKLGMSDKQSIELARYVTAETDAPKKGLTVGRLKPDLVPKEYPDYMRKGDKVSYKSTTVLGELFRDANPLLEVLIETRTKSNLFKRVNLGGAENSVEHFYSLYSFEIKRLLQTFSLQYEADLFSGTPMWPNGFTSNYKQQNELRKTVVDHAHEFWKKWQVIFEEWRLKTKSDQQKILEWYGRPKSCNTPIHSFSLLAMPFVDFETIKLWTIIDSIQYSSLRWIQHNKITLLREWVKRQNVGEAVIQKMPGIECHFYGSSMLGLSEEYSDIDLFADNRDFVGLSKILHELDENALAMKKPHACVSLTFDSCAVDVTNFYEGVRKTYALAETFDENPGFWPALRILIEWARNSKIIKSGGSSGIMTVVSFCHLFVYFASSKTPKEVSKQTPYTIARLKDWIDSVNDSKCGETIFRFLKMLSDPRHKTWINSRVDPFNNEVLISPGMTHELRKHAEIAVYTLAVHDGNIQKLFQFCTKRRIFRIHSIYMNPSSTSKEVCDQNLKEIEAKCNSKKCHHMNFVFLERNGVFYLEVTGDNKHFEDVEREISKIQSRILSARFNGLNNKVYHIANSTFVIPERGHGESTVISFTAFNGAEFQTQHFGIGKSVLEIRNSDPNENWRETEYSRFEERFLSQMELYRSKLHLAEKGTRHWRFFGGWACIIRCGTHYFFNLPETMSNTFETTTLKQVEKNIANLEELFLLEGEANIVKDLHANSKLSLVQNSKLFKGEMEPLSLMPLKDAKYRSTQKKRKIEAPVLKSTKRAMTMRNSFYPYWIHNLAKTREFAKTNGFWEVPAEQNDFSCSISLLFHQRELKMVCNRRGILQSIKHRNTRWLSATFNHVEKIDGIDVRVYLETRAELDDDEKVLETLISYLDGRSIFSETFLKQMEQVIDNEMLEECVNPKPLIPDMNTFNFTFQNMRHLTPLLKFVNAENDIFMLHKINDGIFNESRLFEWFNEHYEVEFNLNLERSDVELCKKSFDLSLKLFDYSKQ